LKIGWGTFAIANTFVRGRSALIAIRLMMGAFEAGFYPTAVGYLSCFYRRYDLAVHIALFYGQYAIAGAFSGSIGTFATHGDRRHKADGSDQAYSVFHLNGSRLYNWQYLFILEGALTVVMALVAWIWLPDGPGDAWFLTKEGRILATSRITKDNVDYTMHDHASNGIETDRLTRRDVQETVKDWKMVYILVFNICASVANQTFSVFLPFVVQGSGYSSIEANLVSFHDNLRARKFGCRYDAFRCQSLPMSAEQ
jgi:MFS family permease